MSQYQYGDLSINSRKTASSSQDRSSRLLQLRAITKNKHHFGWLTGYNDAPRTTKLKQSSDNNISHPAASAQTGNQRLEIRPSQEEKRRESPMQRQGQSLLSNITNQPHITHSCHEKRVPLLSVSILPSWAEQSVNPGPAPSLVCGCSQADLKAVSSREEQHRNPSNTSPSFTEMLCVFAFLFADYLLVPIKSNKENVLVKLRKVSFNLKGFFFFFVNTFTLQVARKFPGSLFST